MEFHLHQPDLVTKTLVRAVLAIRNGTAPSVTARPMVGPKKGASIHVVAKLELGYMIHESQKRHP
jgi:hypothetical protein